MVICQKRWFFIEMSNKAQENSIHLPWYHSYCCFNKTLQHKMKCVILLRVVVYLVVARARHSQYFKWQNCFFLRRLKSFSNLSRRTWGWLLGMGGLDLDQGTFWDVTPTHPSTSGTYLTPQVFIFLNKGIYTYEIYHNMSRCTDLKTYCRD